MSAPGHGAEPPEVDVELDVRGLRCPLPVIRLAERAKDLPPGATIAVLATDLAALIDVPAWAQLRGHTVLGSTPAPDADDRDLRPPWRRWQRLVLRTGPLPPG